MALMAWGMFVFTMDTLPYQQLQHQLKWRHTATARVGQRPSRQYLGPDDETISLSGVLLPELTGGRLSLSMVREMGDMGQAWPLIEERAPSWGCSCWKISASPARCSSTTAPRAVTSSRCR